jgi:xanthine dehydrogenase accessory factor
MGVGDEEGIEAVAGTNPRYAGLVASKEKANSLFQYLRDKGATAEQLDNIKYPAGMDLGGETLPEIALSIMAEITRLRRAAPEQVREPVKASKARSLPVMARSAETESSIESRDPICGMSVDTTNARYTSVHEEKNYYFCCLRCKETFDRSPHLYLETTVPGEL